MRRKTKLTEERFGKKALFKTVLDFLVEPENVRISYVCETHEVEFVMICKKPSGHQRLLFLSYVTLNCYVTFWTGYVITSDYSRVSSRVTRVNIIISESLSRCCCFVSSKGNLPLK